jgi:integrase
VAEGCRDDPNQRFRQAMEPGSPIDDAPIPAWQAWRVGVNVHGMRKLFAAGMAGAGATTHQIAANTGHKTLAMVQRYTEAADQKKLSDSAVGKIQTFTTARKILK